MIFAFILLFVLAVAATVALLPGGRLRQWLQTTITRLVGGVPWIHHYRSSDIFFVSRHDLAEGGLECPFCHTEYHSGDFSHLWQLRVDGRANEVLKCVGRRIVEDGREVACGTLLAASPDTEHGDHLNDDGTIDHKGLNDPDEFYRFRRAPADQYLREKWGMESRDAGEGQVNVPNDPPPPPPAPPADDPKNRATQPLPAVKAPE